MPMSVYTSDQLHRFVTQNSKTQSSFLRRYVVRLYRLHYDVVRCSVHLSAGLSLPVSCQTAKRIVKFFLLSGLLRDVAKLKHKQQEQNYCNVGRATVCCVTYPNH